MFAPNHPRSNFATNARPLKLLERSTRVNLSSYQDTDGSWSVCAGCTFGTMKGDALVSCSNDNCYDVEYQEQNKEGFPSKGTHLDELSSW